MTPTLAISCASLPPEGAAAPAARPFGRLRTGKGRFRGPGLTVLVAVSRAAQYLQIV